MGVRIFGSFPADWARRSDRGGSHADGGIHKVKLTIPELSLIVLIGPSGCGKSTFARKHFKATALCPRTGSN